ncbi:CU044_2847 family protein [Microbispora sp. H13382]|uniref:CU044_2847 family protein n=1 Tax=Microbispora sp. H13382 TaxID=2729112 RepID=UPI00287315EB|nr:CU044_2847 family protein [Microbispora sp. H13382]
MRWEIDGGAVIVETDDRPAGGWTPASSRGDRVLYEAKQSFEDALAQVRGAAQAALRTFSDGVVGPDEVEVEFGVKMSAEAGAIIAKTALEGHLTVKLKWTAPGA